MKRYYEKKQKKKPDFKTVAISANTLIRKHFGEALSFSGYSEFLSQYLRLTDLDIDGSFKVATEATLWRNYMSEVKHYVENRSSALQLKIDTLKANKVYKGDNALIEEEIKKLNVDYLTLRLFVNLLKGQIKFLEIAFWECSAKYKSAVTKLLSTTN